MKETPSSSQKTFNNMGTFCLSLWYLVNQNGVFIFPNLMGNVIRNLKPLAFKGHKHKQVIKELLFRRQVMMILWGVRHFIDEHMQEGNRSCLGCYSWAPVWVSSICLIALAVDSLRSTVKGSKTFKKFKTFSQ